MTTYTLTEKQNMNSQREGVEIQAKNLTQAKRKASRMQCFQGTVLELCVGPHTVAVKESNGIWIKDSYFN